MFDLAITVGGIIITVVVCVILITWIVTTTWLSTGIKMPQKKKRGTQLNLMVIEYLTFIASIDPKATTADIAKANRLGFSLMLFCTQEEWDVISRKILGNECTKYLSELVGKKNFVWTQHPAALKAVPTNNSKGSNSKSPKKH